MRSTFAPEVERGRILGEPNDAYGGAFSLTYPETGNTLRIIADRGSGEAWKEAGLTGDLWEHVSVSKRYGVPNWAEMCWVKSLFFEDEECVIQYHPPKSKYVNVHVGVLHLWRPVSAAIPMPPIECV
jgi:hypothetical protein